MEHRNFGPNHHAALSEHLDKRHEVLVEAHRLMVHELQKLQVEEQMLLRKLYDVMLAEGLTKRMISIPMLLVMVGLSNPIKKSMMRSRNSEDMILVHSLVD